jgi:DNA-directed RNA polymerase subunit RPC12/RpoP
MVYSEDERKERARIAQKKYKDNNREKIAEYYEENREKINEYKRQYYLENKEKIDEKQKQYQNENDKLYRISQWKIQGIIDDDFDLLYDVFIKETNCWICGKEFNKDNGMDKRCLDHDHNITDDGNVRYILCGYCNLHVVG